jgi:hypothetical protein
VRGDENRWLQALPADFFDLILFDEGHHSVAESYAMLKAQFPLAHIVNFSATPVRADGQVMAGRVGLLSPDLSCHPGSLCQVRLIPLSQVNSKSRAGGSNPKRGWV